MAITTSHYTPAIIAGLTNSTTYEAWLLEAVYDLVSQPIAPGDNDTLVYPAGGGDPQPRYFATGNMVIWNWKPRFLDVGSPLVFVTTYKLLDMMIEWVLHQNLTTVPWQFSQKKQLLTPAIIFPALVESRPWLRERLIGLYKEMAELRNTIIHTKQFQSTNGTLTVTPDRGGFANQQVVLDASSIRTFALVMVSLIRLLEGAWPMGSFQEKRLRRAVDSLAFLHGLPSLGQNEPIFQSVRVFVADADPILLDVQRFRAYFALHNPANDVEFCVRIIVVANDGQNATAHLVPNDRIQAAGAHLHTTRAELATSVVPLPNDIDPMASAVAMGLVKLDPPKRTDPPQADEEPANRPTTHWMMLIVPGLFLIVLLVSIAMVYQRSMKTYERPNSDQSAKKPSPPPASATGRAAQPVTK